MQEGCEGVLGSLQVSVQEGKVNKIPGANQAPSALEGSAGRVYC